MSARKRGELVCTCEVHRANDGTVSFSLCTIYDVKNDSVVAYADFGNGRSACSETQGLDGIGAVILNSIHSLPLLPDDFRKFFADCIQPNDGFIKDYDAPKYGLVCTAFYSPNIG